MSAPAMLAPSVTAVKRLDLAFVPAPWRFAEERHAEIEAYFNALMRDKPAVWNGRVLMMYEFGFANGDFHAKFLESDYASLRAWCAWNTPPAGVWDCFGAAAIRASDGGWLLGVMGEHTSNGGQTYFPCGTPDLQDIRDGRVDFQYHVERELEEETGLRFDEFDAEPGWFVTCSGSFVVPVRVLHARDSAEALRRRVLTTLGRETQPELSDIRIVRSPADLDPSMPGFVQTFLRDRWQQE